MSIDPQQIVFWSAAAALAYVYIGYPLLVFAVSRLRPRPIRHGDVEPTVTVLITAFNEESAIRQKIENTLAIDYPREKREIIVASDGSTDRTDAIVREFANQGVRLFRQEGRAGKTATQNAAVDVAHGEIVLFSDATTLYLPDVLTKIVPAFADENVGCVAGRLVYIDKVGTAVGRGAQSYWSYETFVKIAESRACSLIGASGCLYAVRRSAYESMYPEACSDFLICSMLYRKGLRSAFEPEAVCYEQTNYRSTDEWRMRVRVISQTFTDLWRNRDMLSPVRSGFFAVQLISHKLLRYTVPVLLAMTLVSSAAAGRLSPFYLAAFLLQAIFYLLAALGWLLELTGRPLRLLAMPLYFVLANLASLAGFYKFLRGERYARWEPIRHTQ